MEKLIVGKANTVVSDVWTMVRGFKRHNKKKSIFYAHIQDVTPVHCIELFCVRAKNLFSKINGRLVNFLTIY